MNTKDEKRIKMQCLKEQMLKKKIKRKEYRK